MNERLGTSSVIIVGGATRENNLDASFHVAKGRHTVLDPDLIERIRTISLHPRSFVTINEADELLGWSRDEMREAIAGQHELTVTRRYRETELHPGGTLIPFVRMSGHWLDRARCGISRAHVRRADIGDGKGIRLEDLPK